jgi:deoxyinosine 3'endonuclease (endonuclease V)
LKQLIKETDDLSFDLSPGSTKPLKYIGGTDISASKENPDLAVACVVVIDMDGMKTVFEASEVVHITQPYVPGFLAFREVAHLKKLFMKCKAEKPEVFPQVIITDGNGILHPNEFGLACHLGVLLDAPVIGSGKTFFDKDGLNKGDVFEIKKQGVLKKAGDHVFLRGKSGRVWTAVFQATDDSTNPIFISVGHKISIETSVKVMNLCCQFRVPEPVTN